MPDSAPRQPVYLGDHRALTRTAHGHAIFVDTRDLATGPRLLLDGTSAPACAASLRAAVRPGDTVLEIGAGFGELTLLSGELVGESGHVVAFEPDEGRARLLADSLSTNGFDSRARVETGPLAGAVTLDAYVRVSGLRPDVIVLAPGADAHAAVEGAAGLLAAAEPGLRIVVGTVPNGEASLLAAAGLHALDATPGAAIYAAAGTALAAPAPAPAADPAPPAARVTTVVAFADELFSRPPVLAHFLASYGPASPATLVIVGSGWQQEALEERVARRAADHGLPRTGLDLLAVAAPAGSGIEEEIASIGDVLLTCEPAPPAFRFLMRVEPAASLAAAPSLPAEPVLSPDPEGPDLPLYEELPGLQRSRLCTQEQFDEPEYARWVGEIRQTPRLHRKQWEYAYICRSLEERGMLQPGRRGIGFGVGSEPLPALFASYGADIVASDLDLAAAIEQGWLNGNQHASGLEALNKLGICPPEEFRERVSFRVEDMNDISPELHGQFDFTWSSCCFEHLGSIEHGLRFVEESIKLLKPGGVAIHTTEFNLSSNHETISTGGVVIFRRRDIDRLAQRLTHAGHRICLDYSEGDGPADRHVDLPPYKAAPHLRLMLMGYVSTSIGLIVQRGPA